MLDRKSPVKLARYIPTGFIVTEYPESSAIVAVSEKSAIAYYANKSKPSFFLKFRSNEERDKHISDWLACQAKQAEEKLRQKEAKHNFSNDFKVGDIVYDSWGYDQTNIDFFQIVEVKPKSVVMRPISQTKTETEYMSGHTSPVKDRFTGEPILKRLVGYWNTEKAVGVISSTHGWISLYDGKPKSYSSYA